MSLTFGAVNFVRNKIWEIPTGGLPGWKAVPVRCLRTLLLAIYGFWKDQCQKNACVLTYYSLLNIVPLMAVAFGIAKGFGLERLIEKQIFEIAKQTKWQVEVTQQLLAFSKSMLEHVKGGVITGLGVLMLFWTVISIVGRIEDSLNLVWDVKKTRPLSQKFSDYITTIVFAPILFAISSGATVLLAGQARAIISKIAMLGLIGSLFLLILKVIPYISMWSLLTLIYTVLPNTRVPIRSGIIEATAAGTVFQIV